MSRAAEAWFFDECQIRGNDGWVLVTLCSYADDDAYAALSKRKLTTKTRLSEATVWRALATLRDAAVIEFVEGESGPKWWSAIPANRRPRLVRLVQFLGSRFATPDGYEPDPFLGSQFATPEESRGRAGVAKTGSRGRAGVASQVSDQHVRDAMVINPNDDLACARANDENRDPDWRENDLNPDALATTLARFRKDHA